MLRRTEIAFIKRHYSWRDKVGNAEHKYRELNVWQRSASGGGSNIPIRRQPKRHRFNPEGVLNTKGTTSSAWKWTHLKQSFLPNIAPKGWRPPHAKGHVPNAAWDKAFKASVTSLTQKELRARILERLTAVIFEETQRDGYELRKLDFEGRPLEDLPEPRIIQQFVFEEETLRDRVLGQVVETDFRLNILSTDRKKLTTVENVINYIVMHVTGAKESSSDVFVTHHVRKVLAAQPVQPLLGFTHALPRDGRDRLAKAWERLHQLDWQFGKAVYKPRARETKLGNFTWMRADRESQRAVSFDAYVKSGRAHADHKARIEAAAAAM